MVDAEARLRGLTGRGFRITVLPLLTVRADRRIGIGETVESEALVVFLRRFRPSGLTPERDESDVLCSSATPYRVCEPTKMSYGD